MKMQVVFLGCVVACGAGVAVWAAQDDFTSPLLGFFEAGVLCAQESGVARDAPDTVAGTTHVVENAPPFVSTGRFVPAVLGIGFGARVGIDMPLGLDEVLMSVTHPPFAGSGATQQSFYTTLGSTENPSITFYQFDEPYELALGDWTMRASRGGVTFYEVTFTVVPPSAIPQLAGVCGFGDLIG